MDNQLPPQRSGKIQVLYEVIPQCGHTTYDKSCVWCRTARMIFRNLLEIGNAYNKPGGRKQVVLQMTDWGIEGP